MIGYNINMNEAIITIFCFLFIIQTHSLDVITLPVHEMSNLSTMSKSLFIIANQYYTCIYWPIFCVQRLNAITLHSMMNSLIKIKFSTITLKFFYRHRQLWASNIFQISWVLLPWLRKQLFRCTSFQYFLYSYWVLISLWSH